MKKIKDIFRYLANSRGMSLPRIIFTAVYIYYGVYCAVIFTRSVGRYAVQISSVAGLILCVLLLRRSLKLMFDRKFRKKAAAVWEKVAGFTRRVFGNLAKKVSRALGLDKIRAKGRDERDFIFRERKERRRVSRHLRNPMRWADLEDNAEKVRYLFIDYMLRRVRSGYRMKPSLTPDEMRREIAREDDEKLLFDCYRAARYSGGTEPITDEEVEILRDLDRGKGKDRKKQV